VFNILTVIYIHIQIHKKNIYIYIYIYIYKEYADADSQYPPTYTPPNVYDTNDHFLQEKYVV